MGEYAKYRRHTIKIGTCEDMMFLRADQARLVKPVPNSLDPVKYADKLLFRFPFPNEDGIPPGGFDTATPDALVMTPSREFAATVTHHQVRFTAVGRHYAVLLPCPFSQQGIDSGLPFQDAEAPWVSIERQRLWAEQLVLVCRCHACGVLFRLETLEDAQPVVDECRAAADRAELLGDDTRVTWWTQIADRITDGYTTPCDLVPRDT